MKGIDNCTKVVIYNCVNVIAWGAVAYASKRPWVMLGSCLTMMSYKSNGR